MGTDGTRHVESVSTIEPAVLAMLVVLSLVTLWLATMPGYIGDAMLWLATAVCWVILAVAWFVDVALASKHRDPHVFRRWFVAPCVVVMVAAATLSPWPDRFRFVVSERSLDRAADGVEAGELVRGRVGGYEVQSSSLDGDAAVLAIAGGFFSAWELVRAPVAPTDLSCDHLAAHWYLCAAPGLD